MKIDNRNSRLTYQSGKGKKQNEINYKDNLIAKIKIILKSISLLVVGGYIFIILIFGKIISSFFLTIGMYVLVTWLLIFLVNRFKLNSKFIISIICFSILMFSLELYLRYIDKRYQGYIELNGGLTYQSMYKLHNIWNFDGYSPNNKFNSIKIDKQTEYSYTYTYNNIGFRDKKLTAKKKDEYRILAFGDSFTEGVGAPDDSTWVCLLENKFHNRLDSNINIINIGKSGNDPIYNLNSLMTKYIDLKPDMVLQAINNSDINDIVCRGGLERYTKNGNLKLRTGPWWEFFYAYSFIVRHIVHDLFYYNIILINQDKEVYEYETACAELYNSIMKMFDYCNSRNINFAVIVMPHGYEVEQQQYWYGLGRVNNQMLNQNKFQVINLMNLYIQKGMTSSNAYIYYWYLDYHHNSKGYDMFANCVSEQIIINRKSN